MTRQLDHLDLANRSTWDIPANELPDKAEEIWPTKQLRTLKEKQVPSVPDAGNDTSLHRRSDAQRAVNPTKVVPRDVQT